jgi:hypothetical protein
MGLSRDLRGCRKVSLRVQEQAQANIAAATVGEMPVMEDMGTVEIPFFGVRMV